MQIAVIDIGTNTVLLLVARFDPSGQITPVRYEQRVPRLGKGVDGLKVLQTDSMRRVIDVLTEYKTHLSALPLQGIVVCGTSAVREASNRDEFLRMVHQATGFTVEILSGEEEAQWTFRGAVSGIQSGDRFTVVDIGGGSTEISTGTAGEIADRTSLDIGAVRLTERVFKHDPPTPLELETAIELVENELERPRGFRFDGSTLIGVAGTATSLALLAQGIPEFRIEAVTNFRLNRDRVESLFRQLRGMPSNQIRTLSTVMEGRADIIAAGTLILREIMHHYGFEELTVSERGVRYGLAIKEWNRLCGQAENARFSS